MAMIECSECKQKISDKANSCPHCGAPTSKSGVITEKKIQGKTGWITWAVLGLFVLGVIWYVKEQARPALPVEVQYRPALLGSGLVLSVTNASDKHISILGNFQNPTLKSQKSMRIDLRARGTAEIGHLEGWTFASGDRVRLSHNDYKGWEGGIP